MTNAASSTMITSALTPRRVYLSVGYDSPPVQTKTRKKFMLVMCCPCAGANASLLDLPILPLVNSIHKLNYTVNEILVLFMMGVCFFLGINSPRSV